MGGSGERTVDFQYSDIIAAGGVVEGWRGGIGIRGGLAEG